MKTAPTVALNGATYRDGLTEFRVWAPNAQKVALRLMRAARPEPQDYPMRRLGSSDYGIPEMGDVRDADTFVLEIDARPGDRYFYQVDDGTPVPDPVSRMLPDGVHGPTEIVDPAQFAWTDQRWRGLPLEEYVLYELHVGTFTEEGTLDAAIAKLPYLKELGITAVELMPVNAFPGNHNWGYDGVGLYAVQCSYGGPAALRRFVDAAHHLGVAVVLDVVYNHLGNEGNYLRQFGPYFTARHQTPWGEAVNYDDVGSHAVRRFIIGNALHWIHEFHIDGLRLDAVQTIKDDSPHHIVADIANSVHALGRELGRITTVVAETDENDSRYILEYGCDAVWSDDFHHVLHAMFTGESKGYYQDFANRADLLVRTLNEGFGFQGETFNYWKDSRGTSSEGVPLPAHVICIQNHDQVGNRARGERLTELSSRGARKFAAALLLLAPHTPLLFMGQEFDENAPFQFFTDYQDPLLQNAVREGRRREFSDFEWNEVPDPQDADTFDRSHLSWQWNDLQKNMLTWYRDLLRLRREHATNGARTCRAELLDNNCLRMQVPAEAPHVIVNACWGDTPEEHAHDAGWHTSLHMKEDGFEVRVYVRG
ncbi:MAG TPA: malto-oligosyltrehalose trehalohydrolase [Terriglobales bacterium]